MWEKQATEDEANALRITWLNDTNLSVGTNVIALIEVVNQSDQYEVKFDLDSFEYDDITDTISRFGLFYPLTFEID